MKKKLALLLSLAIFTPCLGVEAKSGKTQDPGKAYADLVAYYTSLVGIASSYEGDEEGRYGVLEAARGLGDAAPDEMGYLIEDLSGDGVPELVIGELSGPVNALYTLVGGTPYLVFEGWYRNMFLSMGSGYFYNYASNGASSTGSGIFRLTKDGTKLTCESFLFTAPDGKNSTAVYSNATGSWDPAASKKTKMTEDDFYALDAPGETLPLIPFSGKKTESATPVSVRYLEEAGTSPDHIVSLYDGPNACFLVLSAEGRVSDLTLLSLSAVDATETGAVIFDAQPYVFDRDEDMPSVLTPGSSLGVQLLFPGDLPSLGISFVDGSGQYRRFAIEVSGKDGALSLREADPKETAFILPGPVSR